MPSLFHRRSRSLSTARPQQPANNSAHMAATQAFLANRVSQGNLSASAAAAALRAMSPPPTPVADVQTKRMQRRSSSASSANASRGRSRGGLDRQSSSGSMTERTFRSPSPGRPVTPNGPGVPPPVPRLPEDIPPVPRLKERPSTRSVSLDTYGPRTTSQTAQPQTDAIKQKAAQRAVAAPNIAQRPNGTNGYDIQRTDSRNSVNFSRPLSPPPQSPESARGEKATLRNGITPGEAAHVQYNVAAAAQQPVRKKKKTRVAPRSAEGSHLQSGSMASRPVITRLEPGPDRVPETPQPESTRKTKKKVALTGQSTHFPHSSEPVSSDYDSDSSPEQQRRAQRASGQLLKQPSVVREDWEGEREYEDSQTQLRKEQGLSPVGSSIAPVQSKKTTAANMSRKIEEPTTPPPKMATPVAQPETYHAVSPVEADTSHLTVQQPQPVRQSSVSPSRSTRFSEEPSDLAAGRKHEPLGRSVSPVKSALKHHSPAPAENRVHKPRGSSVTPSDASDSNVSADGSVRRKKSVRVSFEPEPEVVGVAAEPLATDSPVLQSPQSREPPKKGGFFGLGRSRPPLTTIPSDDNLDEHMQPRPQLPSFGSIRSRERRVDSSESTQVVAPTAEKLLSSPAQISSTSSDVSSSPDIPAQDQGTSRDHAIGAIFNQAATRKAEAQDQNLPLPPVVTSVEGGGYISDTESEITVEDVSATHQPLEADLQQALSQRVVEPSAQSSVEAEPTTAHEASARKEADTATAKVIHPATAAPVLSIQPPTPGEQEDKPTDQWLVVVPGGFPSTTGSATTTRDQTQAQTGAPAATTQRSFGPSEAELKRSQAAQAQVEDESASDGDSIYSDAEEDLSDREGFGSIDAIVESPVVESPRQPLARSPPQSPLAEKAPQLGSPERVASWDETEQRWSGIAQQSRQTRVATPPQAPASKAREVSKVEPQQASQQSQQNTAPLKPKQKAKATAASIGAAAAATNPPAARQRASQQAQPAMRSSIRQQPAAPAGTPGAMRSSMRQQGNPPQAKGLQASKWASPESAKSSSQPQPLAARASPGRAALQKKHIPSATTAPAPKPAYKPPPLPLGNDSDSDSSFRKARRTKKSADGGYSMRQSMRSSAQGPPTQPAGRGAVRSLSPPVRRPFSPVGDQHSMRTSMRGSAATTAPTLRGPPKEQKRSSSLFGRRKGKDTAASVPMPMTAGLRSRIGDSDDEDGPRPTTFRSRFADSSDDEADPKPLRPVRGIPKRHDDGDSTDLEDSSDEEKKKPKRQLQPAIRIDTSSAQKGETSDVPLSPNTMKKKGLFSRFRSKKPKGDQLQGQQGLVSPASTSRPATHDDDPPFDKNMGFGSSAERDAMIRQTMARLEAAKQDEPSTVAASAPDSIPAPTPPTYARPQSPTMGKLQRRRPERVMSDSWPLPDTRSAATDDRPATAGTGAFSRHKTNGVSTLRPSMHERKPTNESLNTDGGAPLSGGRAKKKRFNMLRKAFGLKD